MDGFKSYKVKGHKGYLGDFATEWWTSEDWIKHEQHVKELKATGEYGKEFEVELITKDFPLFDNPSPLNKVSYDLIFLDFSKDG